jgi:acetyltransferase EpsM
MSIHWVNADRDSPSDETLIIDKFVVSEGTDVKQGDVILEVEGSKSLFEITAPESGPVYFYVPEGESAPIGSVVACICTEREDKPPSPEPVLMNVVDGARQHASERFSLAALSLLTINGIEPASFHPELDFVTEMDVKGYLSVPNKGSGAEQSEKSRRVVIIGGGHLATLAYEIAAGDPSKRIIGVFDDSQNMMESLGIPLLGGMEDFVSQYLLGKFDEAVIAVQSNRKVRKKLIEQCNSTSIPLCTLIHTRSFVSHLATINSGCIIMDGARVGPYAVLESNVFVSGLVNIDHHCHIGANTTFGPGVFLSGNVTVGEDCDFGTSIGVEPGLEIGDRCSISSGSILHSDVPTDHITKVARQTLLRLKTR